jgi:transcriptional regulator with XRE-family HTH domain
MASFPRVLRDLRKERGLTQKALAERVAKSVPYIAALEMDQGERIPSLGLLKDLVIALGSEHGQGGEHLNYHAVASLVFAALDLEFDLPVENSDAQAYENAMRTASDVWVISDSVTEAAPLDYPKFIAESVRERNTRFIFIVPFSVSAGQVRNTIETLKSSGVPEELLRTRIAVFHASLCAFPARLWITDPLGNEPQGFYTIGPIGNPHQEIRRVPAGPLLSIIRTYSELCSLFHLSHTSRQGDEKPVGTPELGHIRLAYPASDFTAVPMRRDMFLNRMKPSQPALRIAAGMAVN